MLRPLYRSVLRLHPPAFRARFADEMLSIFDTAGKQDALRLFLDALLSLARQWTLRPEFWHNLSLAPAQQPVPNGIPSFQSIDPFRPRAAAVIPGLVLSTAIFCLTCFAIKYSWIHILHVRIREVEWDIPRSKPRSANQGANAPAQKRTPPTRAQDESPVASSSAMRSSFDARSDSAPAIQRQPTQASAAPVATILGSETRAAAAPRSRSQVRSRPQSQAKSHANLQGRSRPSPEGLSAPPAPQAPSQSRMAAPADQSQTQQLKSLSATNASAIPPAPVEDAKVDADERRRVIDGAIANLKSYYVDPDVAQKMAASLLAHENGGDDNAASDGATFADLLTSQMLEVSHDRYLAMVYSATAMPENPPAPTSEDVARYRKEMEQNNCTIEAAEILPHNIGYLKFNAFPDASICQTKVGSAMASLNHADAIIFDLRDNRGGYASMVALIATYLFDRPTHLNDFYNRSDNSTEQSWTLPPVPGNRLADKPVFVLTSHATFSAAEGFSYDLKMLNRATLVGETTSGRGHMGMGHRIDKHFTIRVPGVRVVNPISKTNWEGSGVQPDVHVPAANALETARKLAESKLQKK